jgi:phosphatidylinositol 4-kinase B
VHSLGIICGSEIDQQSLNNRRSHESLDSGETEQSEGENEECIELVETTSMDEDYRELQSDLCFYQAANKKKEDNAACYGEEQLNAINDKKVRYRELNMNKAAILKEKYHQTICVPIEFEEEPTGCCEAVTEAEAIKEQQSVNAKDPKDPMFKSFFFKNAIFRTAQSIIENHEKKNAKNKDQLSALPVTTISNESLITQPTKKRDFLLKSRSRNQSHQMTTSASADTVTAAALTTASKGMSKSSSTNSLNTMKVPGTACMIRRDTVQQPQIKTERGQSGLLRFFESPVFNIHFAIHYLFYSKEPGVLSFIGNKIFSFPHSEVDLYIPQLILMYMQIDELADVLDPYLVYRCRQSADFSLKCSWLLEAYNFNDQSDSYTTTQKFRHLSLMRELYPKRDRRNRQITALPSPFKKTHHRSHSDATGMFKVDIKKPSSVVKLCLGDLSSGRAFDNGCVCFESQRGAVNDLLGQQTVCSCGAPKLASEREFMKSLIDIGKTLTSLPTKIEKTSRLRVLLNLINKNLPARVWLPLNSDTPHHVVRITEDKTAVLNSKDKTPYIIYVEVVEVADIYTSPVILKMMPTLRHTKSDEHLDQCGEAAANGSRETAKKEQEKGALRELSMSRISSHLDVFNDDEVWSQEDDEITAQYLRMSQHKKFERDTVSQFSMESCDSTTKDLGVFVLFHMTSFSEKMRLLS